MSRLRIKKILREAIAERDSYECQMCHAPATQQHHIVYKSHSGADISQNLICLCNLCHIKVHNNGKKYRTILLQLQEKHYGKLKIEELKRRK